MNGPALLLLALSQLPTPVDLGAIAGRVCLDADGDERCGTDEVGVSGVRVLLETGHWAVTDAEGRYHLAAVDGRRFDGLESATAPRLVYGRHRVKVDRLTISAGAQVAPAGATLDVPPGGLATQDFAVRRATEEVATARRSMRAAPKGELAGDALRLEITGEVRAGERVKVERQDASVGNDGVYRARVLLREGVNRLLVRVDARAQGSRYYVQTVEVVRRGATTLVVPRELEAIGFVSSPPSATGEMDLTLEAAPGTRAEVEGATIEVPEAGRVNVPLTLRSGAPVHLKWTTVRAEVFEDELTLEPPSGITVSALLDVEGSLLLGAPSPLGFAGRGAAALRGRSFGLDFSGELDLRDEDIRTLRNAPPASFWVPRDLRIFERALPAMVEPPQWAGDSATIAENPAGARVRAEVSKEGWGRLGFGSYRATLGSSAEVGRVHRSLTAGYFDVQTPTEFPVGARLKGFYAPNAADATLGKSLRQVHDRFEATGGSLFYLSSASVEGSERVRVEYLDGLTGLPVGERHLQRGVDYSIDNRQGRLLLAGPLWALDADDGRGAASPTAARAPVLWVDYETVVDGPVDGRVYGGELELKAGPVRVNAGASSQALSILWRGQAEAKLGPVWLGVEGARSIGLGSGVTLFGSDDGGLTFSARPDLTLVPNQGYALGARARGRMFFGRGSFDLSWRMRTPGFLDAQHLDLVGFRQCAARVEQPLGNFVVGLAFDDRVGADPRSWFSTQQIHSRVAGGFGGYDGERWGARVEARDVEFDGAGRTSVGVSGRFAVTEGLTLRAGYRHRILSRGQAIDDTFASVGVDLKPTPAVSVGLRAGWGPALGPQAWGNLSVRRGNEVHYAGQSLDLDAPSIGGRRFVSGASREVEPGTAVYAEDALAHDATALRLSRAVGLSYQLGGGLSVSGRYERGLRQPFEAAAPRLGDAGGVSLWSTGAAAPSRERDAGGVSLSWVGESARAWLRGEVRSERGVSADLLQTLAYGGAELQLASSLRGTVTATFSHSAQGGRLAARLFEVLAALAWRFSAGMAVLRYTFRRERLPGQFDDIFRHRVSLLPSVRLFSRLSLFGGAHLQLDNGGLQVAASLRPTVRVVGGLELGVEGAVSSTAIQGSLTSLRAEVGYRFADSFLLALGATIIGFNGLDTMPASGNANRIYLRAEAAY